MNGAESLARTLVAGGVDGCFTNPGTLEMHFVAALDKVEGIRCVLGLFEGVVVLTGDVREGVSLLIEERARP
jgi:acetolactate synthase I/II/III large subunit